MTENAIVPTQEKSYFLAPAANLQQLKDRYNQFNDFVTSIMREGTDYQIIPGTNKPSLVKPGAEKLATFFGLSSKFILTEKEKDWTGEGHGGEPFFYFQYLCELYRGEQLVSSCEGSCNSFEVKYRYRQGERTCPKCGKTTIIKGKEEYGGGWLCFTKKGGCGTKFVADDTSITSQQVGRIPNPDVCDIVNTLQKMAQKRSFVGAVLLATNSSERFTQDTEDMAQYNSNVIEAEFVPVTDKQHKTTDRPMLDEAVDLGGEVTEMPIEMAQEVKNSKGVLYTDLDTKTLQSMANSLAKVLKETIMPPEEREEKVYKLAAARSILASRQ
jgi:hypothetical protein